MHSSTDWSAAAWAGLIAGLGFMMLEMGMVWLFMAQSPWARGLLIGAAFGVVIYAVNFHVFAPALFAWFQMARNRGIL